MMESSYDLGLFWVVVGCDLGVQVGSRTMLALICGSCSLLRR